MVSLFVEKLSTTLKLFQMFETTPFTVPKVNINGSDKLKHDIHDKLVREVIHDILIQNYHDLVCSFIVMVWSRYKK